MLRPCHLLSCFAGLDNARTGIAQSQCSLGQIPGNELYDPYKSMSAFRDNCNLWIFGSQAYFRDRILGYFDLLDIRPEQLYSVAYCSLNQRAKEIVCLLPKTLTCWRRSS